MSEPFYEKLITQHFPGWAARRSAARMASAQFGAARDTLASFRGGIATRTSTAWSGVNGLNALNVRGGTLLDQWDLREMSARGADLYRNNPIARTLIDTECSNIVAEGFTCKPTCVNADGSPATDFNAEARDGFYNFMERADITGLRGGARFQQMVWKRPRIEGDGLVVMVDAGGPSKLQYFGRSQISTPSDRLGDRSIIDGVEVNAVMQPIAFHVRSDDGYTTPTWTAVPADNAIYLAHVDEPLNVRGLTVFATVFALLDQLDGYIDAVCLAARAAAALAIIFKVENPQKALANTSSFANMLVDGQGNHRRSFYLENGSLKWIGQKDEVAQVTPQQPMQQTPDFIRAMFKLICLAFEMPVEIGGRDLSQVNFSGGRIGLIQYYRACREKQDFFITRFLDRAYHWWISREVKRGAFKNKVPPLFWAHEFMGREWEYNDPQTEATADLLEIAMGILSPPMAAAKRGRDYDAIQTQIADARKKNGELGIPNVLPVTTRDETVKTTMVDADGNAVSADKQPLNGAQIAGAIQVLTSLNERTLSTEAASAILTGVGMPPADVASIVEAAKKQTGDSPDDKAFQRNLLLRLLDVPAAREGLYNSIGIKALIPATGLPPELGKDNKPLDPPFIPVVAAQGPLVSGAVINDPDGDIVGGDVEQPLASNTLPAGEAAPPTEPKPEDREEPTDAN